MFYYLLRGFSDEMILFNLLRYITFRAFMSFFTAMIIYFIFGKWFMRYLHRKGLYQTVRDDGPATHMGKKNIPTMGGVLILISALLSVLLWGKLNDILVWLGIVLVILFAVIGGVDDYIKVALKDSKGLRARFKFPIQMLCAFLVMAALLSLNGFDSLLYFPFFKEAHPNLGMWYLLFGAVVIVAASNAVNLTDGLDGLVSVPAIVAFFAYAVLSYVAGHAKIAYYLSVPYVAGAGEMTIFCTAIVGSLMAFLWYNSHPASVFMGDVGSLPIGALLGYVSVITKNEILLFLIGGIFVLETLSVISQVISFKLTGKRVFKMAPLHHHFELKGWPEDKVIVRFWIISFILAIGSLATLKIR